MPKVTPQKPQPFDFGTGGCYAQKDEYIDKGLFFDILSVTYEEGQGFEGADRWVCGVLRHDIEAEELMTFAPNEKRDEMMRALQEYIKINGPARSVMLVKNGKVYYFRNAEAF